MTFRKSIAATTAALAIVAAAPLSAEEQKVEMETQAEGSANVGEELEQTAKEAGDFMKNTVELGVDAASATAEAGYDAASDAGAQLDAALTQDAKVRTSDGELVGTVHKADLADDMVLVDLDTQMETSIEGSTENVAMSKSSLSVADDGLRVNMTEQALIEGRAQIQKALDAGVDVSHLDSHMGTLQLEPRYIQVYQQLAVEFDVPLRMPSQATAAAFGFPDLRKRFAGKGIVFPDYFVYDELKDEKKGVKQFWLNIVRNLKPGVTELYIHAAKPTEELRNITNSWETRSEEYETFTNDAEMRQLVTDMGIIRIGYRKLRDLQRAKKN